MEGGGSDISVCASSPSVMPSACHLPLAGEELMLPRWCWSARDQSIVIVVSSVTAGRLADVSCNATVAPLRKGPRW